MTLFFENLPLELWIAALIAASVSKRPTCRAERYLAWILLLPVGVGSAWAGFFHVASPERAAAFIGWQVSPFQFEIGVADLASGIVAIVSFWRSLDFKAAVIGYFVLFDIGVVIGHIREYREAGNTSPGNFGALLILTILQIVVLPTLLYFARRNRPVAAAS